jgi:poly(3-hydroxybutyrate) depolymerase
VKQSQRLLAIAGCLLAAGCGGSSGSASSAADAGSCSPQFKPAGESRCTVTATSVACTRTISTVGGRQVYWQVPLGPAPASGWPAVIVFQGSLFGPDMSWSGGTGLPFGGLNQIRLQALLLDSGFAVIAPTTSNGTYWLTNFPAYDASSDNTFMLALLAEIGAGTTFGPVDGKRLYATGISSGGFMTSRMAISYPGHFAALAIESGGYATCPGCSNPLPVLPASHPPTLLLHGGQDAVVAPSYARSYYAELVGQGIEAELVVDPAAGHQWLDVAPQAITCWFLAH